MYSFQKLSEPLPSALYGARRISEMGGSGLPKLFGLSAAFSVQVNGSSISDEDVVPLVLKNDTASRLAEERVF